MRARQERERNFRREIIIAATEQLFNEKAFESITIDDIAVKSDFAKASIYQYFKNKEELIIAVFIKVMDMECRFIEERCLSQPDPVTALRNYLQLELDFVCQRPWGSKVAAAFPLKEYQEASRLLAKYEEKKSLIAAIIRRGQSEGKFIQSAPDVLTDMIVTVARGYANYFSIRTVANKQSPEIELFISTIIKGLAKEE